MCQRACRRTCKMPMNREVKRWGCAAPPPPCSWSRHPFNRRQVFLLHEPSGVFDKEKENEQTRYKALMRDGLIIEISRRQPQASRPLNKLRLAAGCFWACGFPSLASFVLRAVEDWRRSSPESLESSPPDLVVTCRRHHKTLACEQLWNKSSEIALT